MLTYQNGFTAEIIASQAGQKEAHRLLEEERLTAPAQLVYTESEREINIWIGDMVRSIHILYLHAEHIYCIVVFLIYFLLLFLR